MLRVFNSNVATKYVQLHYFLLQNIGRDKRYCVPLVRKLEGRPYEKGIQQVHSSGAWQLEGPETEETFEWLLLTNSE